MLSVTVNYNNWSNLYFYFQHNKLIFLEWQNSIAMLLIIVIKKISSSMINSLMPFKWVYCISMCYMEVIKLIVHKLNHRDSNHGSILYCFQGQPLNFLINLMPNIQQSLSSQSWTSKTSQQKFMQSHTESTQYTLKQRMTV